MNPCCEINTNLEITFIYGNPVWVCKVCGCRHFTMEVDSGVYESKLT